MAGVLFIVASILVLSITSTEACQAEDDCGLVGKWRNNVNATLIITSCKHGQVEGKHMTGEGNIESFALSGRYTLSGTKKDTVVLGWTVSWEDEDSATSWNGIHYPDEKMIRTMWIFTRFAERRNLWTSNLIYHDEFVRVQ